MLFKKILTPGVISAIGANLAVGITLFSATTVQAEEIRTLKDYLNNCIPENEDNELPEECEELKKNRDLEQERNYPRRERRSRKKDKPEKEREEKSGGIGGYAGITLGIYFPDIDEERGVFQGDNVDDIDTGFGSSIFAGIQFNRFLGLDLEVNALAGEIDSDLDEDENYTFAGIYLNPRFTIPIGDRQNSLAFFISPGIGTSQLSASVEDEVDDFDRTTIIEDDSRFTWQIKGGISIPVSSKLSILPQLRYTSQTGDNSVDYFGGEVGIKFNF